MFVPRVPTDISLKLLEESEDGLDPTTQISKIASKKVTRISVNNKDAHRPPKVRSFGQISDLALNATDSDQADSVDQENGCVKIVMNNSNKMRSFLMASWERCSVRGLFNYDVTKYRTKMLPGSHGFLLQLNEGRITKKRQTEFLVDKVLQEFDESKFNFTKAFMQEVLFQFDTNASKKTEVDIDAITGKSPDLVIINVSPIEYGHILLVPRVLDRLTQIIVPSAMSLALEFSFAVGSPYFRLNYNSFGAYASVNHLHFQGYFLMAAFPSERAPTLPIQSQFDANYVRVSKLDGYPVRGWVFEMSASFDHSLQPISDAVGHVCEKLQVMNIPHNLVIVDCGARVILWPQCFLEKQVAGKIPQELLDTHVCPAVSEIAGHVIVKRCRDFEKFTQEDVWKLLSEASLPADRFAELTRTCFQQ